MQDLSGAFAGRLVLVPSSMSGGNTLDEGTAANLAMTAPGSPSINPIPDRVDILPQPRPSGPQIPVSNAPNKPVPPAGQPAGGGSFALPAFTGSWRPAHG